MVIIVNRNRTTIAPVSNVHEVLFSFLFLFAINSIRREKRKMQANRMHKVYKKNALPIPLPIAES